MCGFYETLAGPVAFDQRHFNCAGLSTCCGIVSVGQSLVIVFKLLMIGNPTGSYIYLNSMRAYRVMRGVGVRLNVKHPHKWWFVVYEKFAEADDFGVPAVSIPMKSLAKIFHLQLFP